LKNTAKRIFHTLGRVLFALSFFDARERIN